MTKESVDLESDKALQLSTDFILTRRSTPKNVLKRREQYVQFPLRWLESMASAMISKSTVVVAIYLLHCAWRSKGQSFKLPNGLLAEFGISRWSKVRALKQLESLGVIAVEYRDHKSPIITVRRHGST